MQHGDLALSVQPRWVVVMEGVLCAASPIFKERRLRRAPVIVGYHVNWHDVPLKRMVYLKERWPDTAMEIVTFISEAFLDQSLEFLEQAQIPYDKAFYAPFNQFCNLLRYQADLRAIYDSDESRLQRYGQYGVSVTRGNDF